MFKVFMFIAFTLVCAHFVLTDFNLGIKFFSKSKLYIECIYLTYVVKTEEVLRMYRSWKKSFLIFKEKKNSWTFSRHYRIEAFNGVQWCFCKKIVIKGKLFEMNVQVAVILTLFYWLLIWWTCCLDIFQRTQNV